MYLETSFIWIEIVLITTVFLNLLWNKEFREQIFKNPNCEYTRLSKMCSLN